MKWSWVGSHHCLRIFIPCTTTLKQSAAKSNIDNEAIWWAWEDLNLHATITSHILLKDTCSANFTTGPLKWLSEMDLHHRSPDSTRKKGHRVYHPADLSSFVCRHLRTMPLFRRVMSPLTTWARGLLVVAGNIFRKFYGLAFFSPSSWHVFHPKANRLAWQFTTSPWKETIRKRIGANDGCCPHLIQPGRLMYCWCTTFAFKGWKMRTFTPIRQPIKTSMISYLCLTSYPTVLPHRMVFYQRATLALKWYPEWDSNPPPVS